MKMTAILLLAAVLQVSASGIAQTITYKADNEDLRTVFEVIKNQTGHSLFYRTQDLENKKPVTVSFTNTDINEALKQLLAGQQLEYELRSKSIFIRAKKISGTSPQLPRAVAPPVTGVVRGPDGRPLAGVNIVIKGTKRGTISGADGIFTIVATQGEILVFSNVGYNNTQVTIGENTLLGEIPLTLSDSKLDEVQVIAYGTTSKRLSTGNVSTVKAKDIENQPVNNPMLALQGRIPGVQIEQLNGLPGGGIRVRVQGQNSIGSGNQPFYVIDGVPYINNTPGTTRGGNYNMLQSDNTPGAGAGSPLAFLNPAEIESIDVLKDADATAIYGSRAANGAILITTKKGKAGKSTLNFNYQQGWGKVVNKLDLLNTEQYLTMRREAKSNDNSPINSSDYDINGTWDTARYTDWQKVLIGKTATYSNANINYSGGNENVQFVVGGTYNRETSVFPGDFANKKGGVNLNLTTASGNKKFKTQTNVSYLNAKNTLPSSDLTIAALQTAPNAPALHNEDGTLNWELTPSGTITFLNPLYSSTYQLYENTSSNLIASSVISYSLFKGLDIRTNLGYNNLGINEFKASPTGMLPINIRDAIQREAYYTKSTSKTWIVEPQLTYTKNIGPGKLEFLAGTTFQEVKTEGQSLTGVGYSSDLLLRNITSASDVTADGSVNNIYNYTAVFTRLSYNLQNKYIITLNGRRDGSSMFGSKNMFNNFGSVAGAWVFSEESFVRDAIPVLSFGKIRASYGTTGNDQIPDYSALNLYSSISSGNPYQGGSSLTVTRIYNPYLQWEETRKLNIGLDAGIWKDNLVVAVNYLWNRSSNQLLGYRLASTSGFADVQNNFPAIVQNTGWEISINSNNISAKNFKWSTSFNITLPKNKLVAFPNLEESSYATTLVVGQPLSVVKLLPYAGVDPVTGLYQFYKVDKTLSSGEIDPEDYTIIKNVDPQFYGGLQNSFSYRNFFLDIMFQFMKRQGNDAAGRFGFSVPGVNINQPVQVTERWTANHTTATIQRYNSNRSVAAVKGYAEASDAAYTDLSYIKLRNLTVGYRFPAHLLSNLKIQQVTAFIQGQNLMTITAYQGLDPETGSAALPPLRFITVGIKLSL